MPFLVYVVALAIAAGTLAFSVELVTRPNDEPTTKQIAAAPPAVRQISIARSTEADRGDPNNVLSPVYPAAPRKDLMPTTEAAPQNNTGAPNNTVAAKTVAAKPPETTGVAPKEINEPAPAPAPQVAAAAPAPTASAVAAPAMASSAAPNSCAVAACGSAYRSFRASDCTYQPASGERKLCALTSSGMQQASTTPVAPQRRAKSRDEELEDVARVVRRLPGPAANDDDRIVVIQRPAFGYGARPGLYYDDD